MAVRLARALGEDERTFAAWARALQRTDLKSVLDATRELLGDPELASFAAGTWTPVAEPGRHSRGSKKVDPAIAHDSFARLRVPVLEAGDDPGPALQPACPVLRTLSLDARVVPDPETLVRPFAYVLGSETVRRTPELAPGSIAIFTRAHGALEPAQVHAVRIGDRVELGHVMWNGRELLLLPAPGSHDFVVLPARDAEAARAWIAGTVARILHSSPIAAAP